MYLASALGVHSVRTVRNATNAGADRKGFLCQKALSTVVARRTLMLCGLGVALHLGESFQGWHRTFSPVSAIDLVQGSQSLQAVASIFSVGARFLAEICQILKKLVFQSQVLHKSI